MSRSVSGEMHSGFAALRSAMPMNLKARYEDFKVFSGAQADIDRITEVWRRCLSTRPGPFLFGERPTMADAMYAPVCSRFTTYGVDLEPTADGSLTSLHAADEREVDELVESADLFIVDFGLDATLMPEAAPLPESEGAEVPSFPESLRPVAVAFDHLVKRERARLERGMHPRRFLLVNSTTVYLDTFVVAQLRPEAVIAAARPRLFHLRTQAGRQEVDVVAELGGGRVIAVEIKASAAPHSDDARHLAWLRDRLGERFVAGFVLHTGPRLYTLGDRLTAAPISVLWPD